MCLDTCRPIINVFLQSQPYFLFIDRGAPLPTVANVGNDPWRFQGAGDYRTGLRDRVIGWRPGGKVKKVSIYSMFWRLRRLGGKRKVRINVFIVCLDTFRSVIFVFA